MQYRMLHQPERPHHRTCAVVFEEGDEVLAGLQQVADSLDLNAGSVTALGAFSSASLGFWQVEERDYRRIPVDEQVEVLSLVGDVTRAANGEHAKVHLHAVLGRSDGSVVGGHLLEARVRPTLEVLIAESPGVLRRRHDPRTGLALIDLESYADTPEYHGREAG